MKTKIFLTFIGVGLAVVLLRAQQQNTFVITTPTQINGALIVNTLTTPIAKLGSGQTLGQPTGTITAVDGGSAGNLNGTYRYCYTEMDTTGETVCSAVTSPLSLTNRNATVTIPLPRRGTTSRSLYRTGGADTIYKRVRNFNGGDNYFETVYTDNIADGSLGVVAPTTDTTVLWDLEVGQTVKYFRTSPSIGGGISDLTLLTAEPSTQGSYAIDAYGEIVARTQGNQVGFFSYRTAGITNGYHFLAQNLTSAIDSAGTNVFQVMSNGGVNIATGTLTDQNASDGLNFAIQGNTTFATTNNADGQAYGLNATGAGSSSFEQRALRVGLLAGYTGATRSAAISAVNQTVGTGIVMGLWAQASGATTGTAAGVIGNTANGTRQIGVYGNIGDIAASALTFNSGVTANGGAFSNGTGTGDIIAAYDNTTAVFAIQDNGNALFSGLNANSSTTFTFNTASKAAYKILANGNTDIQTGSTNNAPVVFLTNNQAAWKMDTAGHLTVNGNGKSAPSLSSCGTGTLATGSSDSIGRITATGATACTLTFGTTFGGNSADCMMSNITANRGNLSAVSSTAFTVSNLTSGDVVMYMCMGR